MKILINIGHPAHVHYFRNMMEIMKKNGHEIIIIARDRPHVKELLDNLKIPFYNRGKGKNSLIGKLLYMFKADYYTLKLGIKYKPDIFMGFASAYSSQVAYLLRKPCIILNDTEHADKVLSKFVYPFTQTILTPNSYYNNLGTKQLRFNAVMEYLYLHPNYFKPDLNIRNILNIKDSEEYVIIRFVSWNAHHDVGQSGLDVDTKRKLIGFLKKKYKVFISSENDLPEEFRQYQIEITSERMHDVLASATLFIGESATMASESALLGTHAVYINSLPLMGYLNLEQGTGLLKHFNNSEGVLPYVKTLLDRPDLKSKAIEIKNVLIKDFINPTAFLIWFIENYPESNKVIKENPDYQYKFV